MEESAHFAGLDIGGTTVKAALLNESGRQVGSGVEVRSHGGDGYKATFKQLRAAIDQLCSDNSIESSNITAVGIDVPAPSSDGVIWGQANLNEDWVGTNIRDEFSKEIHRPCYMTNDGNAAAYGEWILRPGPDGPLLFVAPGTGLGGGFVLGKGQLYEGCNGLAMEIGAISVPFREEDGTLPECAGKGPGSLEAWVSLVALRRRLKIELDKDENNNATHGDVITQATSNSLIHSSDRLVTTIGLDNIVIVDTPDAVLVANKDSVQDVKNIVAQLKNTKRTEHIHHREVYRPWGRYDSVDNGERFQVKRITVKMGAKLSVQMHHHRAEHWIVVSGTAKVRNGDEEFLLTENQSTYIPIGTVHSLENPGKVDLELIEVQSGSYLGEDDIVRFEDKYGRSDDK